MANKFKISDLPYAAPSYPLSTVVQPRNDSNACVYEISQLSSCIDQSKDELPNARAVKDYIDAQGFISVSDLPESNEAEVKSAQDMLRDIDALLNKKNLMLYVRQDGVQYDSIKNNWKVVNMIDGNNTVVFREKPSQSTMNYDANADDIIFFQRIYDAVQFSQKFKFLDGSSLHIMVCTDLIWPLVVQYKSSSGKTVQTASSNELSAYSTRPMPMQIMNVDGCSIYVTGYKIDAVKPFYSYKLASPVMNPQMFDQAATYMKNDLVLYGDEVYQCVVDTHQGSFNANDFAVVSAYSDKQSLKDAEFRIDDIIYFRQSSDDSYARYVCIHGKSSGTSVTDITDYFIKRDFYTKTLNSYAVYGSQHMRHIFIDTSSWINTSYASNFSIVNQTYLQNLVIDGFKFTSDRNIFSNYCVFAMNAERNTYVSNCAVMHYPGSVFVGHGISLNNTSVIRSDMPLELYAGERTELNGGIELIDNERSVQISEGGVLAHNYNQGGMYISVNQKDSNTPASTVFEVRTGGTVRIHANNYRQNENAYFTLQDQTSIGDDGLYIVNGVSSALDVAAVLSAGDISTKIANDLSNVIPNPSANYFLTYTCLNGQTSPISVHLDYSTDDPAAPVTCDTSSYFKLNANVQSTWNSQPLSVNSSNVMEYQYNPVKSSGYTDSGYVEILNNPDFVNPQAQQNPVSNSGLLKTAFYQNADGMFKNYESDRLDTDSSAYKKFLGRLSLQNVLSTPEFQYNYDAASLSAGGKYLSIDFTEYETGFKMLDLKYISRYDIQYSPDSLLLTSCLNNSSYYDLQNMKGTVEESCSNFNATNNVDASMSVPDVWTGALSGQLSSGRVDSANLFVVKDGTVISSAACPDNDIWTDKTRTKISVYYDSTGTQLTATSGSHILNDNADGMKFVRNIRRGRYGFVYNIFEYSKISVPWNDVETDDKTTQLVDMTMNSTIDGSLTSAEYRVDRFYQIDSGNNYQNTVISATLTSNTLTSDQPVFNTLSGCLSALQKYCGYSYSRIA